VWGIAVLVLDGLVLVPLIWIFASSLLAFATRFLPVAYSGSETALRGLDVDLENAVRTLGGLQLRRQSPETFRRETDCALDLATGHAAPGRAAVESRRQPARTNAI